ncbi:MAG: antitoxin [Candidatus Cloacimonetes bacterium]|nr:antitoxin [Candidatus Cloacimonadota bacterium]
MDKYEKEILDSFEKGEWLPTEDILRRKKALSESARNTFLKNKRINIRLSEKVINEIKAKSLEEGIPYQTLIASVLHKYVKGCLVEK